MEHFNGVDVAGVMLELETFIREAAPKNASASGFITTTSIARCGRERALALVERARPILDRLYPEWRRENPPKATFEFASERDASMRLLERMRSRREIVQLLGDEHRSPHLNADQMHPVIWSAASTQWTTRHFHEAVLAGAKAVNSMLQSKIGRRDVSEAKLVREAFTEKAPGVGKPRLRFESVGDDQTRESMRQGAMDFGAGCFMAIRNPVGHLPNEEHELTEQHALERLAALSLFARWIDQADLCTA